MQGIEFLSYANTSPPYPVEWVSTYSLLMDGLKLAVSRPHALQDLAYRPDADLSKVPPSNLDTLRHAPAAEACIKWPAQWSMEHSDRAWYARTLGRCHVNSFRVDAPEGGRSESLMVAALAAIAGEQNQRTGSAVYFLASMLNHSCSLNADISFAGC
ncbi:hypothetical protein WJX74_005794 [Apatococcus lobatus]|uniref:SET domain-containing protein n=1 Tax=Apatococcus lobatus TaxID=904363 RepID=A0AAW1QXT8_9CHLO